MLKDMTKGSAAKLILVFTIPMFIGNVFQQLYNMVDSVVVGRFVGPDALAAVGTSAPIIFFLISLVMGLTLGSGVIISQFFGAQQMGHVRRAASTALIFQTVCGLILSVVGFLLSRPLLLLLRTPPEIINDSVAYMRIYFCGLLFLFTYNTLSGILRALGDSKTPLYFLAISAVTNTILDVLFVARLGWGVAGVAWATLIAQALSSLLCVYYITRRVPMLQFSRAEFVFDREMFKMMAKIGIPSSIQQSVVSMGMMAVQGLINSFGGVTMAAYTAAARLDTFAMMPVQNFGMALSSFAGQNIGAGRLDRVHQGLRATLAMVVGVSLCVSVGVFMFGPQLIQIFVSAERVDVISRGVEYLKTVSIFYAVFSVMIVINGLLRGAGDTVITMATSLFDLGTRVVAAYWLVTMPGLGYRGIWWSIPIGWSVSAVIPVVRYLTGGWKAKVVVRQQMFEQPAAD